MNKKLSLWTGLATIGIGLELVSPVAANPGETLDVGVVVGQSVPTATVYDTNTQETFVFGLRAIQQSPDGRGDVVFGIGYKTSPPLRICAVHGADGLADFQNSGSESGQVYYDSNENVQTDDGPLNRQCGRAYGEQVTIDNCKATIQAHAYQHSDHPLPSYLGPVGLEITLEKTGSKWTLTVVPSTPVNTTKFTIKGPVTGTIAMSSCP